MAVSTVITRRAVFKGVPAAIVAPVAFIYTDMRPSLDALFDAWKAELDRDVCDDADLDAKCDALIALERKIISAPALSVRDVYIKVAVADGVGEMDLSSTMRDLAAQAWGELA